MRDGAAALEVGRARRSAAARSCSWAGGRRPPRLRSGRAARRSYGCGLRGCSSKAATLRSRWDGAVGRSCGLRAVPRGSGEARWPKPTLARSSGSTSPTGSTGSQEVHERPAPFTLPRVHSTGCRLPAAVERVQMPIASHEQAE